MFGRNRKKAEGEIHAKAVKVGEAPDKQAEGQLEECQAAEEVKGSAGFHLRAKIEVKPADD